VLVADSSNPQVLYAGDALDGVYATTDAGQHWSLRNQGLPAQTGVRALSFDASNKKLFAATTGGIFSTTTGGQPWNAAGRIGGDLPTDTYTSLAFDLGNAAVLYCGTAQHGVYVSTTGGVSWSPTSGALPSGTAINALAYDTDQHQLWAATSGGVYRTADAGKSWQALNTGFPRGIDVYAVRPASMSGGSTNVVFAGTGQGVFRSDDSGRHWQYGKESLSGVRVQAILVDFRAPTTVYIATSIGVFRSTDNGELWGGIVGGSLKRQPIYALELGADGYTQLYAASDDVYLYPGSGGGFDFSRITPLILIVAFFVLLYWLTQRNRRNRRAILTPAPAPATEPSNVPSLNGHRPVRVDSNIEPK
jgi:photosystem II stability/assembly factor-like uncharacterized protein